MSKITEQTSVKNPWVKYSKAPREQSNDFDASKIPFSDFLLQCDPEDVETYYTQWGWKITFYDEDNNPYPVNISDKLGKWDEPQDAEDAVLGARGLMLYYGEKEHDGEIVPWMTVGKEGAMKTTGRKKFNLENYKKKIVAGS